MFLKIHKNTNTDFSSQSSDLELIEFYKKTANAEIVGLLFERYTHIVFGMCMKYLRNIPSSKDAVMEIFEKLLDDLKKHQIENFKSWLYTYTKNYCLMQLRKIKYLENVDDIVHNEDNEDDRKYFMEFYDAMHLTDEEDEDVKQNMLKNALSSLNEDQKKCIELMYLKGKSYKEITDLTGFDLNKVKSFIQNGKRNLKIYLEGKQ